jgi:hypothetical protein
MPAIPQIEPEGDSAGTTVAGVDVAAKTAGGVFVFIGRYDTPGAVIAPDVLPSRLIWLAVKDSLTISLSQSERLPS